MEIGNLIEMLTMLKNEGYEDVAIKLETNGGSMQTDIEIEITEQRLEAQVNLWAKGYVHE